MEGENEILTEIRLMHDYRNYHYKRGDKISIIALSDLHLIKNRKIIKLMEPLDHVIR